MAKLTWKVINYTQSSLDITQYVRSLTYTQGRPTPLSPYSGYSASLTMTSYGGIEQYVSVNDQILISATPTGGTGRNLFTGFVTSRTFDDNPGDGINSTMTVSLNDAMLQAGIANFQSESLVSVDEQIKEINTLLPQVVMSQIANDVDISTGTFTTNASQRINEIIAGDRGVFFVTNNFPIYIPPSVFGDYVNTDVTIGRTTSATQIAYQNLVRVEAASNSLFYTQATVTGSASTVTKTSATSSVYGVRTFTATTAQSNLVSETAKWYANAFTDPEAVTLNLSLTDVAQDPLALKLSIFLFSQNKFVEVSYTPPGGVSTTGYYWPEQMTFNATTSQTTIDMVMTPLTYYANFILDDSVFGVLDTDRLGVS